MGTAMSANVQNPKGTVCQPIKGEKLTDIQATVDNVSRQEGIGRRIVTLRQLGTNCQFNVSTTEPVEIGEGVNIEATFGDEFWSVSKLTRNSANQGAPIKEVLVNVQELSSDNILWTSEGAVDLSKLEGKLPLEVDTILLVRDGVALGVK
jgi:hypothetical protein